MSIDYRVCTSLEEFEQIKELEMLIWTMPDSSEAITTHIQHVLSHIGGLVIGAYDGGVMVGMAVALPTRYEGRLWSHMAGVHPDYQGQGIGYQIKQFQREEALKSGYREIRWTFDPAMRGNAHFNFHLLKARTNLYHPNFYGLMTDGINAGVPSDRFEAIWRLDQEAFSGDVPDDLPFALEALHIQAVRHEFPADGLIAVACPYDFTSLKAESLDLAKDWRKAMQTVFQEAFTQGYEVVDFVVDRDARRCWYVLQRVG